MSEEEKNVFLRQVLFKTVPLPPTTSLYKSYRPIYYSIIRPPGGKGIKGSEDKGKKIKEMERREREEKWRWKVDKSG